MLKARTSLLPRLSAKRDVWALSSEPWKSLRTWMSPPAGGIGCNIGICLKRSFKLCMELSSTHPQYHEQYFLEYFGSLLFLSSFSISTIMFVCLFVWVLNDLLNHWTKRVVNTWLTTQDPTNYPGPEDRSLPSWGQTQADPLRVRKTVHNIFGLACILGLN